MNEIIKKIDEEVTSIPSPDEREELRCFWVDGYIKGLRKAKEIIQAEQKEPCEWCNKGYRFEFNWIDENGNTVTTKDHMVIGDIADYCPVCGRPLNQKAEEE